MIVRHEGVALWSPADRNHYSSLRCKICDLPPLRDVHFGDGWVVAHMPGREAWLALPIAVALARPPPVGVRIMTCGSAVCIFRAERHGVPGATP